MAKRLPSADKVATGAVAYKQSKEDRQREEKWRAEEDMRTLTRANEIREDKYRMNCVKKIAREQMETAKKFVK